MRGYNPTDIPPYLTILENIDMSGNNQGSLINNLTKGSFVQTFKAKWSYRIGMYDMFQAVQITLFNQRHATLCYLLRNTTLLFKLTFKCLR